MKTRKHSNVEYNFLAIPTRIPLKFFCSLTCQKSEEEILQNHIEALKQQVSNLEEKCLFCSDKIEASIRLLQAHIVKQSVKENDPTTSSAEDGDGSNTKIKNEEQLVALANLKQVNT